MLSGNRCLAVLVVFLLAAGRLCTAERVTVELNDGSKVEGELLKKDAKVVHLSVADSVIALNREQIKEMRTVSGEDEAVKEVQQFKLYQIAKRSVKAIPTLAEELGPAVVIVKTPSGLGTGWFCHQSGYVVTNQHVVSNEQSITVTAYERQADRFERKVFKKVKLVALDESMDLALLKIEEEIGMAVPQLYLGDSAQLKEGDTVFTIGNPLGLERSTSQGIVSKVNRNMNGRLYVQTTAPIAPGNSGGPLFNDRGEVIGITNMGYIFLDGLGFAIPSTYVKEFLDNVEAFSYDPDNPNSGTKYMETPLTATDGSLKFTACDFIKAGQGISCLRLADVDGDGVKEIVFVNNNKGEIGILARRKDGQAEKRLTDFEDINQLPESDRFKLTTYPVNNTIYCLVVEDINEDRRPDLVFYGDIDGVAVREQKEDGSFDSPRRIGAMEVAKRIDALRVTDLDGDGKKEIFALGTKEFAIFKEGSERKVFPLNAGYAGKITEFDLRDVNGDNRLDLVIFSADKLYATHVLIQNGDGNFIEEQALASHLSGPVKPCATGSPGDTFLTLDKGQNRLRLLTLDKEEEPVREGTINTAVASIALEPDSRSAEDFETADLDGDGKLEIVTVNRGKNEFLILQPTAQGFRLHRSPAPKGVSGLKLFRLDDNRSVLFCFSQEDKFMGVSRIDASGVTFPRPINTEGLVQFLWVGRIGNDEPVVLWAEKIGQDYAVRYAPAAALAEKAFDGQKGSIDVEAKGLLFADEGNDFKEKQRKKPDKLCFADFNGDGRSDLVVYWSFSGKESLYLGLGDNKYRAVIADQEFLEQQKGQPLMVADIDGDGQPDVLLVQPGFVRVLKVDAKDKLYVERQFNWKFEQVTGLVPYGGGGGAPRFVALAGNLAKIVEFDMAASDFKLVATVDLAGLEPGELKVGDVDGNGRPDILLLSPTDIQILYSRDQRSVVRAKNVFDARLDYFTYWNLRPADLDGDGKDEVLLFDSKKAMFEVYRPQADGSLEPICRQRLFEKTIRQRGETDSFELPQELAVGDVDGNGKPDLVFILQDRLAIYLQDAAG
jgi:serine protease Do